LREVGKPVDFTVHNIGSLLPRLILIGVGIVGIVNFVTFVAVAISLGGDALNGYASDGRCFLGEHGRYTEVSASVFQYSKWHARSLFLTHPAAMLAGYFLTKRSGRPQTQLS
jgi:hypothetical protein